MKLFFIFHIITLFYFVNSFAITYSECYYQQQSIKNANKTICNGNGKCHLFFGCQCFDGFDGESCQLKVAKKNGCFMNKCFEGSECIEISSSQYYCECPANRYGHFCEFEDPCFDCIGKCFEIAEDIFECDELGKRDKKILNQSESINSTFINFNTTVPSSNTTSINQNECPIADYCQNITDNNICDSLCNTEICAFDFNDCNLSNVSTTVYRDIEFEEIKNEEIYEYIFYIILFFIILITAAIFICVGKLILKRWKKISEEIDAENAAIRRMYINQAAYFTV